MIIVHWCRENNHQGGGLAASRPQHKCWDYPSAPRLFKIKEDESHESIADKIEQILMEKYTKGKPS